MDYFVIKRILYLKTFHQPDSIFATLLFKHKKFPSFVQNVVFLGGASEKKKRLPKCAFRAYAK